MIVNTIYARNPCGPLGPSTSREVFAFDLTDVSTLAPYTDATATTRRSTVQLELSDLATDCDKTYNRTELATQTHPILDDDTRCNPFLAFPPAVKRYGYPYWKHCGIKDNKFGIFDPPYAVPTAEALVPAVPTTTSEPEQSANPSAAESASTGASASSDQAPTTAGPTAPVQITDEPSPETVVGETSSIDPQPHAPNPDPAEPTAAEPEDTEPPTEETDSYPDAIVSIVTGEQVVSLGPSGLEIVDVDSGSTTTHFVPAPGATDDGFGEDFNYGSDFAPAPVVIYNGETLSVGGDPATITGAVVVTPSFHNLESISATTSNTTVPASSANRAISGLIIPLAILVLSAHL
jgi:hypothetical protein